MRAISRPTHGIRARPSQPPSQRCLRVALPMGLAILLAVTVSDDARPQVAGPPDPQSATAEDITRDFVDPTLDPDAWVAKLEIESREVFTARKAIIAASRLEPGDRIADIGSGTGVYLGDARLCLRCRSPLRRVFGDARGPPARRSTRRRRRRPGAGEVKGMAPLARSGWKGCSQGGDRGSRLLALPCSGTQGDVDKPIDVSLGFDITNNVVRQSEERSSWLEPRIAIVRF